jgi:Phosphate-induced protein 1 conserved region
MLAMGALCGEIAPAQTLESAAINSDDIKPDGRGNHIRGLIERAPTPQAVVNGNGINYHGGSVLHTVNLYYILYGNWGQTSLNPSGTNLLTTFAQNFGGTPYFNINTTYGDSTGNVPNAVTFKGSYKDTGSLGTSLSDSSIGTLVVNAINSGTLGAKGVADPNGLYLVLTAPGVAETSGFITKYCGWHSWGTLGTTPVQYGFVGNAAGPSLGHCAYQSSSPNNDPGVDAMISVIAHELSETVSDPQGTGWYDSTGAENGDKCAWNFGQTYRAVNGSFANVNMGGKDYLIQQMWLNALGGKCALSYTATPDFGVSVSGAQSVQAGQTSAAYTVTTSPVNGFSGTITWSFVGLPSGIAATPSNAHGNSTTFILATSSSLAAGTYTIPVTATSGSLSHTVSATLVVTAPTFNLTINPSSKIVTRPTAGKTTTVTYAVTVSPVGAFTKPVTLTASGGTTGVTVSITGTNPVNPGSSGTLSVTLTNSALATTRTLTVTGTASGVASKQATALITIQ